MRLFLMLCRVRFVCTCVTFYIKGVVAATPCMQGATPLGLSETATKIPVSNEISKEIFYVIDLMK